VPFTVTIQPSGHRFSVDDGETVLAAALREGFPLAYGCRDGACGTCKGRVLDGTVDYGHHQESALSQQDKAAGFALFCCARPLSDLAIECREVAAIRDIPVRKLPCRVQKIVKAAPTVLVVSLKLPANERMQFLAGQYLDFLLKDGTRRSFSMANAPHDDELLELHIRNYGGSFSQYAFGTMKERDILRFEGPLGTFFLRDDSAKPIVLVAGGTGFAPIKAVIEDAFHKGVERPMTLYWGARVRADLYLDELPQRWAREHAGFKYVPVLSEARPEENWSGRSGLVHQAVMEDFADLSGCQVYVCGVPAMVDAARRDFTTQRALPESEFYSDSFTPASA